jgi:hypothetical protein
VDGRDGADLKDIVGTGAFELGVLLHHQGNGPISGHHLIDQPE